MAQPPRRPLPAVRRTRRHLVAAVAAGSGALLLATAGGASRQSGPGGSSGQDDDDDGGSGRGRGRGRGGDDRDDETAAQPAAPIPPGAALVEIFDDDGFTPPTITVDPGQPIAFVNRDGDDHTATGSAFDTGIIPEGGGVATVVLDAPGTYPFACRIHPEMVGTIGVRGPDGTVPPPAPATPVAAGATTVRIAGFAFDPPALTVPPGTTVAWSNEDAAPHTATALGGAFDSGILDPGGAFSHTFAEPGRFPYRCEVHPSMQGEIVVEGAAIAAPAATPAAPGATTPAGAPAIAGIWSVALTPDGSGFATQAGVLALRGDGTLDAALAPSGAAAGDGRRLGPGFGNWRATGGDGYALSIAAPLLDDGGRFAGRIAIGGTVALDAAGNALTGTIVFETRSADGAPDASGGGTMEGARI